MKHTETNVRVRISSRRTSGFTLLEVVIAMAMLAVIAIPALGLATMSISRNKEQMLAGNATELKNRVDIALRANNTLIFDENQLQDAYTFYATESLSQVDQFVSEADRYYRIVVQEPSGYNFDEDEDSYRVLNYEIQWPMNSDSPERKQVFFTSVFRK